MTVGGSLALGLADVEALKGQISADVALGEGSSLTSENGDFALKKVTAESGAQIEVRSGTLSVDELAFTADEEQEKTSTIRSAEGAAIAVEALNAASPNHTLQFEGNVSAKTLSGEGTLLVGSESAAATVAVNELSHSGVIFIDPPFEEGRGIEGGSFFTAQSVGESGLASDVIVGRNSVFVFGGTKEEAIQGFQSTKKTWGDGSDEIGALFYIAKPLKVGSGSVTVDGAATQTSYEAGQVSKAEEGQVLLARNTLTLVNGNALTEGPAIAAKSLTALDGAQFGILNLSAGDKLTVFDVDSLDIANKDTFFVNFNSLVDAQFTVSDGLVKVSAESLAAKDVFPDLTFGALLDAANVHGLDEDSTDRGLQFLSRLAQHEAFGVADAKEAAAVGNEAAALAATAGVYNVALDASKLMNRTIDRRMTLKDGMTRPQSAAGATVWADVMATTNEAKSLYGHSGYSVDLYGAMLGADVEVGQGKAIGAAFTVGTGDGETKDAAMRVDSDADFVGFSLYGSHQMGSFMGKIDAGWMHTKSDLSARAFGMSVGGEISADAWTVGIGGEYRFEVGSFGIMPHIGIRWTRLDVDGYDGVFRTESDAMNVWTAPIGVAFSGRIQAGGWKLAPFVDLSVVPSFGDDEAASRVRWGDASAAIRTKVVDDAPFQAALGLSAECGSWTLGASYDLGIGGDDRLDNAFTLKARYAF